MPPNAFPGEFEQMVLLAILRMGERAFALEVRRTLEERAGRSVSRGAFYTTLDRLESKGMVEWEEAEPEDSRRSQPLRRFSVTPDGVEAVRQARRAMDNLWQGLDHLVDPVR
jgi:DNA-binding PadR family transcriptional regulator